MENQKLNELEELLLETEPKVLETGVEHYDFIFSVVKEYRKGEKMIEFDNLQQAIEITNQFTTPDKKEKNTQRLIDGVKRLRINKNGKVIILAHSI